MTTLSAQDRERLIQSGAIQPPVVRQERRGRKNRANELLSQIETEIRAKLADCQNNMRRVGLSEALAVVRAHYTT